MLCNIPSVSLSSVTARSPKSELDSFGRKRTKEDQMRMKRFSSALCLADKQRQQNQQLQQQQQVDKNKNIKDCHECGHKLAANHNCRPKDHQLSAQELKRASRRKKSAATNNNKSKPEVPKLVEPPKDIPSEQQQQQQQHALDPMILARQRRPSVCNQASVNVDQQGEFPQSALLCLSSLHASKHSSSPRAEINNVSDDNNLTRSRTRITITFINARLCVCRQQN